MSKQRGTFRYPGSKTLIRRWIIKHIPEHHLYVEPFGGAASILVGKDRSKVEVYNDINDDCVNVFEASKKRGEELATWIENTPYSRKLFDKWCDEYPEWPDDIVERAGRFAFIQNSSFSGKGLDSGTPHFSVTKVSQRPDACGSKVWDRKPGDIEWLKKRFKKVQIEKDDYETILTKYDNAETFFYCDPPYIDVGNDYYQTEDGGFNHERFVSTLQDLDGKWLVSYEHNIPSELRDYTTVDREKKSMIDNKNDKKTESLVMNYDPNNTPMFRQESQEGLDAFQ